MDASGCATASPAPGCATTAPRPAIDVGLGTPIEHLSLSPVGWLDGARLVVAARPLGCDGPADVWIWNLLDGSATLLAKTVEFAAVRSTPEAAAPLAIAPDAVAGEPALIDR